MIYIIFGPGPGPRPENWRGPWGPWPVQGPGALGRSLGPGALGPGPSANFRAWARARILCIMYVHLCIYSIYIYIYLRKILVPPQKIGKLGPGSSPMGTGPRFRAGWWSNYVRSSHMSPVSGFSGFPMDLNFLIGQIVYIYI